MILRSIVLTIGLAASVMAQTSATPAASGPTTRVLAIGRITEGSTAEKITPVMQQEVRDTVRLYLAGKLDQWFSRRDERGVVFLLNVSSVVEARALLEALPLGKAKLMSFDLIPLGPLAPLGILAAEPAAAAK
jgi:DNA-binding transcriptional regulator YdaS (Cro superfamily)